MKLTDHKSKAGAQAMHTTENQNNKKEPAHPQESAKTNNSMKNLAADRNEKAVKNVPGQVHSAEKNKRKP